MDGNEIKSVIWRRVVEDADGQAVRALLGANIASIIEVDDLPADGPLDAQNPPVLPERPFIALRMGLVTGSDQIVRQVQFTWYCYDDLNQRMWRLNKLQSAIEQAYRPELKMFQAAVGQVEFGTWGEGKPDLDLGLYVSPFALALSLV